MTACVLGKGPFRAQTLEGQGVAVCPTLPCHNEHAGAADCSTWCAFSVSSSGPFLGPGVHGPVFRTGRTQVPVWLLFRMQM